MFEYIKNFIKDLAQPKNWLKILGSRMFSSVFYLGFLPDWNRHWSAAFAVLTSVIFIFNFFGLNASPGIIAYSMALKFIYILIFAMIMIPLFRFVYKPQNLDVITIDAYLSQILVFALCVPAIVHIDAGITSLLIKACNSFLYCNKFIFSSSRIFLTLLGPYMILRFFDIFEFWPSGYMFLYLKNSYLRLIAGIIPAIYTSISIYLFCFLFFDLELSEVISFYKAIFLAVYYTFYFYFLFYHENILN